MSSNLGDETTIDHASLGPSTASGAPQRRATLVFYCPSGSQLAELAEGRSLVVGRKFPAEVLLDDPSLSRQHARFSWTDGGFQVEDLGSRNGTVVNGEPVEQARIRPEDSIRVGGVVVALHVMLPTASPKPDAEPIVQCAKMRSLYETVERVARTISPVLILGETGTGKELIARAIHDRSPRAQGPFRATNCGAIPATLLESTLFGHERGSFTGADKVAKGLFEQAEGGTVFLDEVGELSLEAQAALLRVIDTKRVQRVGSQRELSLDVRVVAATHRDLEAMVQEGGFRSDLLYRLNAFTLSVPPLRERGEEIEPLAEFFVRQAGGDWNRSVMGFAGDALQHLKGYSWPGNVRELRNAIERAVIICSGNSIEVEDLPESVRGKLDPNGHAVEAAARRALLSEDEPETEDLAFRERVRQFEIKLIVDGLERARGNQTKAAQILRIPLRTLVHKLRAYGIKKRFDTS